MIIIFGLGNPDKKYENTYHNMGWNALDVFAAKHGLEFTKTKYNGLVAQGVIDGEKVMLIKPLTYMNLSGKCVREAVNSLKLDLKNILVVYDDIDLPAGALRIRQKGSAGTHNGMRNIVAELNSQDFPRLRLGVGKDPNIPLLNYVLARFSKENAEIFDSVTFPKACKIMELFIKHQGDLERINVGEITV